MIILLLLFSGSAASFFGVNCSPFLLNGTLRVHLQKYELDDPEFVAKMLRSLYVDDLVSGGKEEMKGLYDHASKRLAEGGGGALG